MNQMAVDEARLERLLGGTELANLRRRLRARFEKGALRGEFTLTDLGVAERRALAGLLGRPAMAATSMRLRYSELDEALARAGIASTLREALEVLDGPLHDRRAAQIAQQNAWNATVSQVEEPRLAALLSTTAGTALVKRLSGSDPVQAAWLLTQTTRVLAKLPGHGISRAQLAAEVLGDSHSLDMGRPVATLVLRACAVRLSIQTEATGPSPSQDPEESVRDRWARVGVTVNELALPVLCLNLPVEADFENGHGRPQRALPLDVARESRLSLPGEPTHISLRRLLRRTPNWNVAGRDVFVCENPNIVAVAADRLGTHCAPLACTDGMPAAAQQRLLAQLAARGARLRYHGDFDWAGLAIGNFVMREFGAEPWRFGAADYLSACGGHGVELRDHERVMARWDDRLTNVMSEQGAVVHEEAVVETLLTDLATILPDSDR
ncbi:MAG TPA: TIGR02679 family protein [Steroidobacteraceae bacterium]